MPYYNNSKKNDGYSKGGKNLSTGGKNQKDSGHKDPGNFNVKKISTKPKMGNVDRTETFGSLGLHSAVVDALNANEIDYPTPMQARAFKDTTRDFADIIVETVPHEGRSTCIAAFAMHCALSAPTPSNRCAVIVTDSIDRVDRIGETLQELNVPKTHWCASYSCKSNQPKMGDGADVYVSTADILQNANNADCSTAVTLIVEDASRIDPVHLCRLLRKFVAASPIINIALFTRGSPCDVDYSVRYMLRRTARRYLHSDPASVKPRYTFLLCHDQFDRAEINARLTQLGGLRRVLILTHNKEVRELKSHLHQEFGFRTYSIQRSTTPVDRERVLSDFLACDFAVLVAMDAYTGVDLMDCDAVIQYYPPQKSMPDIEWREFTNHLNTTSDARTTNPCLVTTLVGLDDLALCSFFQHQVGAVDEPILNVTPFHKRFAEIVYNPREVAAEKMGHAAEGGEVDAAGGMVIATSTGTPNLVSNHTEAPIYNDVVPEDDDYYDDYEDRYDDDYDDRGGGGGGGNRRPQGNNRHNHGGRQNNQGKSSKDGGGGGGKHHNGSGGGKNGGGGNNHKGGGGGKNNQSNGGKRPGSHVPLPRSHGKD